MLSFTTRIQNPESIQPKVLKSLASKECSVRVFFFDHRNGNIYNNLGYYDSAFNFYIKINKKNRSFLKIGMLTY